MSSSKTIKAVLRADDPPRLTGKTVWTCPSASLQDCNDAVDGLAAFQPQWEKVPASAKRAIFLRAADLVTEKRYADRIRNCMSSETAAAPGWIHVNIIASANLLREAASQASAIKGEVHRSEKPDVDMYIVQRRAAGVSTATFLKCVGKADTRDRSFSRWPPGTVRQISPYAALLSP